MGSVTNVVGQLRAVQGGEIPHTRLSIPRYARDVYRLLLPWGKAPELELWYREQFPTNYEPFERLRRDVSRNMASACEKSVRLREEVSENDLLIVNIDRKLLNETIEDVIAAFQAFYVVANDPELYKKPLIETVFEFLKQPYRLAITLMDLSFPPQDEDGFLFYWTEFLEVIGLQGFVFDFPEYYKKSRISDITLKGVLAPSNNVPASYLPIHPSPPFLYLSQNAYMPRVLKNGKYAGQNL